jgi:hypothetical protein
MTRYLVLGLALLCASCPAEDDDNGVDPPINACARDIDCPAGRHCGAGDACVIPGNVSQGGVCMATRDCAQGLHCTTGARCQPGGGGAIGAACLFDGDCAAGLRCNYLGFTGFCQTTGAGTLSDPCTKQDDCIAGLYCGATGECQSFARSFTPFPGVNCASDTSPFHSYFEVPRTSMNMNIADFFRLPYPNDARVNNGDLYLADFPRPGLSPLGVDVAKLYTDALVADFDGFSPMIAIAFRFSKDLDFDRPTGHFVSSAFEHVRFVDLTETPNVHVGMAFGYTPNRNKFACENFLTVYPQAHNAPLTAGHTYAVVLGTGAIRSATGDTAQQDPDLAALLGPTRPTDADLGRAWDAYAKLRTYLSQEGIAPATVANATVFTVSDPKRDMQLVRDAVAAESAPVLSSLFQCGTSTGADPCSDNTEARRCPEAADPDFVEVHGKISMPIFQMGTQPYERPADGGGLNIVDGRAVKVRNEEVCFALTLPKGDPPQAGWPLLVHGHGTGGSFRSFISDGIATQMAKASPKVAVMSFDSVGHGQRRGSSARKPEELVFNVVNPRAARDNFAQGAADLLTAFKLPRAATPQGWTGPTLRFAPKVAFFGHSQGATHGSLALPFTDDAPLAVLSGAGASLALSLQYKTSPVSVPMGIQILLGEPLDPNHAMLFIWQNFFDRADPANFNRHIIQKPVGGRAPKHVYMSWGTGDTFSPPATLKANAAFLGVPPVRPFLVEDDLRDLPGPVDRPVRLDMTAPGGNVTAAVFQYAPPDGSDGHFVATRNTTAVRDWVAFLASYFSSGTPAIP